MRFINTDRYSATHIDWHKFIYAGRKPDNMHRRNYSWQFIQILTVLCATLSALVKKGVVISRVGTDDGISIDKPSAPGTHGTLTIGDGTSTTHAINKGQLDAKFGTGDSQVRSNTQMDARYVLTSTKNTAGGFAGVGTNGKIESSLLPDIRLNRVFVVLNKFGRNVEPNLVAGDSCIITPTALYNPGMIYAEHDVVRVMEYGITKFYATTFTNSKPYSPTGTRGSGIQISTVGGGNLIDGINASDVNNPRQVFTVNAGGSITAEGGIRTNGLAYFGYNYPSGSFSTTGTGSGLSFQMEKTNNATARIDIGADKLTFSGFPANTGTNSAMSPANWSGVYKLNAGDNISFKVSTVNGTQASVWWTGTFHVEEI